MIIPAQAVSSGEVQDMQSWIQFVQLDMLWFAALVVVSVFIIQGLMQRTLNDLGERFTDRRLTFKKIGALGRFALYFLGIILVAFSTLNLSGEALFGLITTLGVAFAFAFKDLFASLMAGVILLVDEPFQVGDRITYGGYYGEVSEIGLRSVRLITLDDNLVTIPNSAFLTDPVASANAGALDCMVVVPIYIGAAEPFYRARRLVYEAAVTSRYVYLDKPVVTQITDEFLGERFVTVIRVKAYVFDARYEKHFVSDVTERVKVAFQNADIRTPDRQYRDLDLNEGSETAPGRVITPQS